MGDFVVGMNLQLEMSSSAGNGSGGIWIVDCGAKGIEDARRATRKQMYNLSDESCNFMFRDYCQAAEGKGVFCSDIGRTMRCSLWDTSSFK